MTVVAEELEKIAAEWRSARRIYPIYIGISGQFGLDLPHCKELECPIDRSEPEIIARLRQWIADADEIIQVHQLRQFLQTNSKATESSLRALIQWHVGKAKKDTSDRDKVDFLLVQYFCQCAPAPMHLRDLTLEDVAQVLEPVLGEASLTVPVWLDPLHFELDQINQCASMKELLRQEILCRVRKIKASVDEMYFGTAVMLAFTRFNYMMRRVFFRLMRADLDAIREGLHELKARKVITVDCTAAGLSDQETVAHLEEICGGWKRPFHAEYSAGNNFVELSEIRISIEKCLEQSRALVYQEKPTAIPEREKKAVRQVVSKPGGHGSDAANSSWPPRPLGGLFDSKSEIQQLLEANLQQIRTETTRQLSLARKGTGNAVSTVVLGGSKLPLSSWEMAAFVDGSDEFSQAMQRGVAVRLLLADMLDRCQRGVSKPHFLAATLVLAHAEAALLQERVAQARDARNIDEAVAAAATSKRLLTAIEEADTWSKRELEIEK